MTTAVSSSSQTSSDARNSPCVCLHKEPVSAKGASLSRGNLHAPSLLHG
jgi:hypothetical protein